MYGNWPPCICIVYHYTAVEEHVANHGRSLVDLERVTAEHDPLTDDPVGVHLEQRAHSQQLVGVYTRGAMVGGGEKQRELALRLDPMESVRQCEAAWGFRQGKN